MSIKQHPTKGPGWWEIRISRGRKLKPLNYTAQGTRGEAEAFEAELKGAPVDNSDCKLIDVSGRWLDHYKLKTAAKTYSCALDALPHIHKHLGSKHISLLRQTDFDIYKNMRLSDGVCRKTINNELSYLRSMLNFCRDQLRLPPGDLPKMFPKKQVMPSVTKTPYTIDEMQRLLAELHGDKKTIVMLYCMCGLRRNEALNLTRGMIDLTNNLLTITGKGNKTRIMPIIGPELHQRLEYACSYHPKMRNGKQRDPRDRQRKKNQDEYLFLSAKTGQPYTDIKKGIKAAAERAKIDKPIWNHLLRHSFGTAAIRAGVNLRSLQTLLGHGDIRMTEIYTHMAADHLTSEGAKIADLFGGSGMSGINKPEKDKDNQPL